MLYIDGFYYTDSAFSGSKLTLLSGFSEHCSVSNVVDPEMFEKSYAGFSDDNDQH